MIKLRLQRKGRKKRPFYHIVVADSRSPRDGRIIEQLGRFDNVSENKELTYDEERIIHWLKIGAQPSNTVRNILQKEGILYKMHLMRWGKSEEEINSALEEWKEQRTAKEAEKDTSRKAKQKEILKSEEKEFKKQLEEKAAAAAKELEKKKEQEAKAAEAEETTEAEEETEAEAKADDAVETEAAETAEEKTEETAAAEEKEVEEPEPKAETEVKADEKEEEPEAEVKTEEVEAEAETEPEKAEAEPAAEEKEETKKAEPAKEEEKAEAKTEEKEEPEEEEKPGTISTDMNATEAIDHIKNTPLEELKGFVPDDEERVTVQRAWDSKQED